MNNKTTRIIHHVQNNDRKQNQKHVYKGSGQKPELESTNYFILILLIGFVDVTATLGSFNTFSHHYRFQYPIGQINQATNNLGSLLT